MPLKVLKIYKTGVTDLKPLQGMALEEIHLTPKNIAQGLEILRDMKSLKTIGIDYNQAWPAAEFWERYDKGEFGAKPFTDPVGAGTQRVYRGGQWFSAEGSGTGRSSDRSNRHPADRPVVYAGFRVACEIGSAAPAP